jgi:hypothetical protein
VPELRQRELSDGLAHPPQSTHRRAVFLACRKRGLTVMGQTNDQTVALPSSQTFPNAAQTASLYRFDAMGIGFTAIHLAIVGFVVVGWTVPSRPFLFAYLLVLPMLVLQWLSNHGSSVINNCENLVRNGSWNDSRNPFEGAFFKSLLGGVGLFAPNWLINVVVCTLMLMFWIDAMWRMILIVPSP